MRPLVTKSFFFAHLLFERSIWRPTNDFFLQLNSKTGAAKLKIAKLLLDIVIALRLENSLEEIIPLIYFVSSEMFIFSMFCTELSKSKENVVMFCS